MSDEIKKPRQINRNRVTLTEACSERLGQWERQIGESLRGVSVRPTDLVEWLVMGHSESLSPEELQDLQQKFWDDIAVASWALRELKRAKVSGESLSLQEILGHSNVTAPKRPATLKRKSSETFPLEINPLAKEKHDQNAGG